MDREGYSYIELILKLIIQNPIQILSVMMPLKWLDQTLILSDKIYSISINIYR